MVSPDSELARRPKLPTIITFDQEFDRLLGIIRREPWLAGHRPNGHTTLTVRMG